MAAFAAVLLVGGWVWGASPGGTRVTVTERGFAGIPAHRRGPAFQANSHGWTLQLDNLAAHVAG